MNETTETGITLPSVVDTTTTDVMMIGDLEVEEGEGLGLIVVAVLVDRIEVDQGVGIGIGIGVDVGMSIVQTLHAPILPILLVVVWS